VSGGSYEYLYCKEAADFLGDQYCAMDNLNAMADRLAGLGHADAARESRWLYLEVRRCQTRIESVIERLSDVWHAVDGVLIFPLDQDSSVLESPVMTAKQREEAST